MLRYFLTVPVYFVFFLFGFVSMSSSAQTNDYCEQEFLNLYSSGEYPTVESKVQRWESVGEKCAGSGIYEARLAGFYVLANRFEDAGKVYSTALGRGLPYKRELLFGLADLEFLKSNLQKSADLSKALIQDYPDWAGGYFKLGQVELTQDKYTEAIISFEKSNNLSEHSNVHSYLAISYHYIKEHQKAITAMQKAIKLDRDELKNRLAVPATAYSLIALGYLEEAKDLLVKHQQVRPESRNDPDFAKAAIYLQKKLDEQSSSN